jgi:hypothetical protein
MPDDEMRIDAAQTRANIEYTFARQVVPLQHVINFFMAARREKSFSPHELQCIGKSFGVLHAGLPR